MMLREPPMPEANIPVYIKKLYAWLRELAMAVRQLQEGQKNGT